MAQEARGGRDGAARERLGGSGATHAVCHDSAMALVESVPNVSEGRRLDVVDRLAAALRVGARGASPGPDERRRPTTGASSRSPARRRPSSDALERLVAVALDEIDMEQQSGEHPRIGAVDVVPFVPLGETTLDECVGLARDFGRRIAARFDLPVYLYAAAATRPDRVKLADVRRGQYEGLKRRDRDRAAASPTSARRGRIRAAAPPASGRARSSSPGTSTSRRTTWSWRAGSPTGSASRRAACRRSRPRASSSRSSAAPRSR